jgi:formylglycine-generating enzyme required for sulfatase activity
MLYARQFLYTASFRIAEGLQPVALELPGVGKARLDELQPDAIGTRIAGGPATRDLPGLMEIAGKARISVEPLRESGCASGPSLAANFRFENLNRAYAEYLQLWVGMMDGDGIIYAKGPNPGGGTVSLNAGPGQTVDAQVCFPTRQDAPIGRYFLFIYSTEPEAVAVFSGELAREPDESAPPHQGSGGTWTRPPDGMVMVRVPGGEFWMGSSDEQGDDALELCEQSYEGCGRAIFEWETPRHIVRLDDYWIDQTEVTVAQFRAFVAATGHETLAERNGAALLWDESEEVWRHFEGADWQHPTGPASLAEDNHPVVQVEWEDAAAYCAWAGGRLPTEAEWEYAARGPQSLVFPWGDTFDGTRLNYCDTNCESDLRDGEVNDGYARTAPVGSYPAGATWCGALDMAGNAWEWVSDWFDPEYYAHSTDTDPQGPSGPGAHIMRGGSWRTVPSFVRSAWRGPAPPGEPVFDKGFRCARDA